MKKTWKKKWEKWRKRLTGHSWCWIHREKETLEASIWLEDEPLWNKNKWTIINKNIRKCKELPDQNLKKKKINVFFIALQMYVTLPVMSARKCHPLHHAQVQSQKFCTLGSCQRECYEQPNHDGRPKKTNKQIRRNECYEITQTRLAITAWSYTFVMDFLTNLRAFKTYYKK